MMQIVLSDENCVGHCRAIFQAVQGTETRDLVNIRLQTFDDVGLAEGADDEVVWRFCQENRFLLLTGNRTKKDGKASLEAVIQDFVELTSLPVLTIGNMNRVLKDPAYCKRCAEELILAVFDLEKYLGITRLYLT